MAEPRADEREEWLLKQITSLAASTQVIVYFPPGYPGGVGTNVDGRFRDIILRDVMFGGTGIQITLWAVRVNYRDGSTKYIMGPCPHATNGIPAVPNDIHIFEINRELRDVSNIELIIYNTHGSTAYSYWAGINYEPIK